MKRVKSNWVSRLQRTAKPAGKALAAAAGSAATVLGIAAGFGFVLPASLTYLAVAWCFTPPIAVIAWKSRSHHLPDVIIDESNPDGQYEFRYCTVADLREANSWTKPYFGHEYVSDEIVESWQAKAPCSFVGLFNADNQLSAAFGIIAIEASFMTQFIKGRVTDNTLKPDDLLDDDGAKKNRDLYISGVVVRDPDSHIGRKRACAMFWGMAMFIDSRYGVRRKRNLYALAVSSQSKSWLLRAGFLHNNGPSDRIDKLELYSLKLTKERIAALVEQVGDYSGRCSMQLER